MKKIELVKFIFGITFCLIAILGAITFFLGYWNIANGHTYSDSYNGNNFSQIWSTNTIYDSKGVTTYTSIFLGLCGICGCYLLTNVKSKD